MVLSIKQTTTVTKVTMMTSYCLLIMISSNSLTAMSDPMINSSNKYRHGGRNADVPFHYQGQAKQEITQISSLRGIKVVDYDDKEIFQHRNPTFQPINYGNQHPFEYEFGTMNPLQKMITM